MSVNELAALMKAGRSAEAERLCRKLLAQRPRDAGVLVAQGAALAQMGQLDAALRSLNKALKERPGHADAANAKGVVLERLGRPAEAAESYRLVLQSHPDLAPVWFNLGNACRHAKDEPGALAAYARAVALSPGRLQFLHALVGAKRRLCDWDGVEALAEQLSGALATTGEVIDPFRTLNLGTSEAVRQAVARRWSARFRPPAPLAPPARAKDRLVVGYFSPDLREHAVSHLAVEHFELHDRARFSVRAYSTASDDGSALRRRVEAAFDSFTDCSRMDAAAIARRMADDGVDILVDLGGYTRNSLYRVPAYRPAPVQAQWLGYPGTLGTSCIDYVLGDPVVLPESAQPFYDEAIVRLPHSYLVSDRNRPRPEAGPSRAEFGLPPEGAVLACFNNSYKLGPQDFSLWMSLLRQTEGAVLWLYGSSEVVEANLQAAARAHGVDPGRLVFARRVPSIADHLARYHHVDLFLDTLPYNAHTTASDALWMGCPVVTMMGDTFAGRVGASLLRSVRLDRLVTRTPAEYEAVALSLLRDPDERAAIRRHLWEGGTALPLFDTPAVTRAMERAFTTMWERAVAGLPPAPFDA